LLGVLLLVAAVGGIALWASGLLGPSSHRGFDVRRAILFANLAGAAYCSAASLEAWDCGPKCIPGMQKVRVCQGETTQAFVGVWEGKGLVSFQGTKSAWSMFQDLRTWSSSSPWEDCAGCSVHSGFLAEWTSLRYCIMDALSAVGKVRGSSIRITGHSLGAAVSSLGAMSLAHDGWIVAEAYNFGMPRAGNAKFSAALAGRFGADTVFRVTHHMDPVPHVPPEDLGFMHYSPEVFFDKDGADGPFVQCADPEDTKCAGQYSNIVMDAYYINDHLDYMGINTGSTGCSKGAAAARAFEPAEGSAVAADAPEAAAAAAAAAAATAAVAAALPSPPLPLRRNESAADAVLV